MDQRAQGHPDSGPRLAKRPSLGAALFILAGILSGSEAFAFIDWNVIFLLIGMMFIVNIARHTGLFQYIAIKAAKLARGEPILIAVELGISPVPFLGCGAIASNIGGTATLIGDPPNIMIGSAAGLSFLDFLTNLRR